MTFATEASLGYYTNAAVGLVGRIGWLRSEFWTFSSNPMTAANQAVGGSESRKKARPVELYAFGAVRARAVAYNALLQGQLRHSDVTLHDTAVEHLLREWEAGVVLAFWKINLVGSIARRSAEYSAGEHRSHTWGGIYVIVRTTASPGARGR